MSGNGREIERQAGGWWLSVQGILGNLVLVSVRALRFFRFVTATFFLPVAVVHATLSTGTAYRINFVDVNGNKLSTADGHMTVVALTTAADHEKARIVGDRVPDFCLGNPNYRMITVVHFTGKHAGIGQRIATAFIRHRMREAAKRLQARYGAHQISRDANADIFVVADFDGTTASQLGQPAGATDFSVFVFGRTGELLAQWHDIPSADQLAAALK